MPRFSLIVPTVDRSQELECLLLSLAKTNYTDYELIAVDQNEDDRLLPLLVSAGRDMSIRHVRTAERGASKARNLGLSCATGDIIAFPDDDCWYPPDVLSNVDRWFDQHPEYDILTIGAKDERGLPSGNRWIQSACDIRPINAFRTTFCNSLFLRGSSIPRGAGFDPLMLTGEETDYVLRLLRDGLRGRFDRSWYVGHPRRDMLSGTVTRARAVRYGQSIGRLSRKHSLFLVWAVLLGYDLLRATAVATSGRIHAASMCAAHAWGVLSGIWATE